MHGVDRRIAFGALSSRLVGTQRGAHPARLRRGRHRHLDVDQQHRDHRDDVPDRPVDRRAPDQGPARPSRRSRKFAMAMMLITSFGASIGGMATPVGTPPNLIGIGMIERIAHVAHRLLPLDGASACRSSIILFAFLVVYFFGVACARGCTSSEAGRAHVAKSCSSSGRCRRGSATSLIAFGATVCCGCCPAFSPLPARRHARLARVPGRGAGRRGRDARRDAAVPAADQTGGRGASR